MTTLCGGAQEDLALVAGHKTFGKKWKRIAMRIGSRCGAEALLDTAPYPCWPHVIADFAIHTVARPNGFCSAPCHTDASVPPVDRSADAARNRWVSLVKRMPLLERNHEYDAILAQAEGAFFASSRTPSSRRPCETGNAYHLEGVASMSTIQYRPNCCGGRFARDLSQEDTAWLCQLRSCLHVHHPE